MSRLARSLVSLTLLIAACSPEPRATLVLPEPDSQLHAQAAAAKTPSQTGADALATEWMRDAWDTVRASKLSPPVASRAYAYLALALYEAGRYSAANSFSLAERFKGFTALPKPQAGEHDWRLAASTAAYVMMTDLFRDPQVEARAWQRLLDEDAAARARGVGARARSRSFDFGYAVGTTLSDAAAQDGFADTRGRSYTPPSGGSAWVPTGPVSQPLEPYWGELRGFSFFDRERCRCPAPPPYATEPSSALYAEARAVYDVAQTLTDEQRTVARFWADGAGDTGTPPGHWLLVVGKLSGAHGLGLAASSFMFALVQTAIADAFVAGWREKYAYNLLRPVTYIQRHIDAAWQPLIATPPFPEYVSGHSVGSAAAAEMLTAIFGPGYAWQDDTATDRGFAPRDFGSFADAAREAAMSRLYGGIHFPIGNDEGLALGRCIADQLLDAVTAPAAQR